MLEIISYGILMAGIVYGAVIIKTSYDNWKEVKAAPGSLKVLAPFEFLIFMLASLSLPDYLMQTILGKQLKIVTDKELPGTVVGCGVVPGAILAFLLLKTGADVDIATILVCGVAVILGSLIGGFFIGKLEGDKIKRLIQIALVISLIFLIVKIIVSRGQVGSLVGFSGVRLYVVAGLCFLTGIINMLGVPMKPTRTAIFLIAGMSPITTVTTVVVLGSLSPLTGGIAVLRKGIYQRKMVFSAVTWGVLGSIVGAFLVISIPSLLLNIILIAMMIFAFIIML